MRSVTRFKCSVSELSCDTIVEVGVLEVRMFSPVSSSALAITNVGYGADELNDSAPTRSA